MTCSCTYPQSNGRVQIRPEELGSSRQEREKRVLTSRASHKRFVHQPIHAITQNYSQKWSTRQRGTLVHNTYSSLGDPHTGMDVALCCPIHHHKHRFAPTRGSICRKSNNHADTSITSRNNTTVSESEGQHGNCNVGLLFTTHKPAYQYWFEY